MASVQLGRNGMYSLNVPSRLAKTMNLVKGEECTIRKGKKENELVVTLLRD